MADCFPASVHLRAPTMPLALLKVLICRLPLAYRTHGKSGSPLKRQGYDESSSVIIFMCFCQHSSMTDLARFSSSGVSLLFIKTSSLFFPILSLASQHSSLYRSSSASARKQFSMPLHILIRSMRPNTMCLHSLQACAWSCATIPYGWKMPTFCKQLS